MSTDNSIVLISLINDCRQQLETLCREYENDHSRWLQLGYHGKQYVCHNNGLDFRADPEDFSECLWYHVRVVKAKRPITKYLHSKKMRAAQKVLECKIRLIRLQRMLSTRRSDVTHCIAQFL